MKVQIKYDTYLRLGIIKMKKDVKSKCGCHGRRVESRAPDMTQMLNRGRYKRSRKH